MSKRSAEYQLTKDNYDQDDNPNYSSHPDAFFQIPNLNQRKPFPQEPLKERKILKAKRKNLAQNDTDSTNVFSGFKGFSSFGSTNASNTFSFNLSADTTKPKATQNNDNIPSSVENENKSANKTDNKDSENPTFLANLNKLNKNFCEHISQYTSNTSSIYDLTLVCEEYISKCKKLRELSASSSEKEKNDIDANQQTNDKNIEINDEKNSDSQSTIKSSPSSSFAFSQQASLSSTSVKDTTTTAASTTSKNSIQNSDLFSFGVKSDSASSTFSSSNTVKNDDGNKNSSSLFGGSNNSGFSFKLDPKMTFGSSTSSLFGANPITSFPAFGSSSTNVESKKENKDDNNNDDGEGCDGDEEQPPPKVKSIEHQEDDAVYTKKCKLYYKKEENFVEKGLGYLYIKKIKSNSDKDEEKQTENDERMQLLIRADTNMGTILLNISLNETIPIIKADKGKGVLLTCVPNPPLLELKQKNNDDQNDDNKEKQQQTVTYLIRVKQTDCDELYDNLMKYKR